SGTRMSQGLDGVRRAASVRKQERFHRSAPSCDLEFPPGQLLRFNSYQGMMRRTSQVAASDHLPILSRHRFTAHDGCVKRPFRAVTEPEKPIRRITDECGSVFLSRLSSC